MRVALGELYAFYGRTEGMLDNLFRDENIEFANTLWAAGVTGVQFSVYPGGHSWSLWTVHAASWLGAALQHAAPPTA